MDVKAALSRVRFVLVEPQGPLNVGSVARAMKNMGLAHLYVVNPQCDVLCHESRQMAVGAVNILEAATVTPSLPEALGQCQRVAATTHRHSRTVTQPMLQPPKEVVPWLLHGGESALVFGSERRGLTNVELGYCQRYLTIPAFFEYPVLNVAQAAALCAYELFSEAAARAAGAAEERARAPDGTAGAGERTRAHEGTAGGAGWRVTQHQPAPHREYERFYEQLQRLLWDTGYVRLNRRREPYDGISTEEREWVRRRMFLFRGIFNKADMSALEVRKMRGVLSALERAIRHKE